ncbi:glycosyltransferase family 4 protein [Paenibacillus crassostreae]|uniref:Spore coat protein n=1 Tax=Paenibacillus crassostreae TaxID=1763538 RepID=A0A162KPI9_9BACL|nr:glycosyltransferase family 4 protein [Paenibacillus crassostreae]AOZ93108.1 spore coat protein [Paenibacillus crassostreae]OAB71803.1 spore coat protein [Paenibacillus crassostreae]
MHILIVAPEQIPVPGSGSVEICILAIARQLARNHRVTIISKRSPTLPNQSLNGNMVIIRVPSGSTKTYISSVLHYMNGRKYDVIQVDNRPHYMARIKQAFPRTPVTLFLHSLTFVPKDRGIASCLKKADLIIANSSSLKEKLAKRFPDSSKKIKKVELGVDISRFRVASEMEKVTTRRKYLGSHPFTILFVGRVIPRKGVPILIEAASLIRRSIPVHIIIAGSGTSAYMKRLKLQAYRMGVPITFIGKKPHSTIHKIYRLADCFVCPSQKHEAFGLVNVEAMASGIPVIASRNGGIQEIVQHGHNGYLVDQYHHPQQFASYLLKLATDKSLRERLGANGRSDVLQHFTWSRTAAKLASLYRNLQV